jgi:hypothetical protein
MVSFKLIGYCEAGCTCPSCKLLDVLEKYSEAERTGEWPVDLPVDSGETAC